MTVTSAWAPIRSYPIFRALWTAQFASNVGTWMQTVGAHWLLIDRSPLLVSLVQAAASLPIVLLALPAGAWADLVDRRHLLLGAQLGMFPVRRHAGRHDVPRRPLPRRHPRAHLPARLRQRRRRAGR